MFALAGPSSSLYANASSTLGPSDGVIHGGRLVWPTCWSLCPDVAPGTKHRQKFPSDHGDHGPPWVFARCPSEQSALSRPPADISCRPAHHPAEVCAHGARFLIFCALPQITTPVVTSIIHARTLVFSAMCDPARPHMMGGLCGRCPVGLCFTNYMSSDYSRKLQPNRLVHRDYWPPSRSGCCIIVACHYLRADLCCYM